MAFSQGMPPVAVIDQTVATGFTMPTGASAIATALHTTLPGILSTLDASVDAVSLSVAEQHYIKQYDSISKTVTAEIASATIASVAQIPDDVAALFQAALQVVCAAVGEKLAASVSAGCPGDSLIIVNFQHRYANAGFPSVVMAPGLYDDGTATALANVLGTAPPGCHPAATGGGGTGGSNPGPVAAGEPAAISTTADILVIITSIGTIGYLAWKMFSKKTATSR